MFVNIQIDYILVFANIFFGNLKRKNNMIFDLTVTLTKKSTVAIVFFDSSLKLSNLF